MSYAGFLVLFLGIPLIVSVVLLWRQLNRALIATLALLALVALVYTGPWDNLIVANGVWSYHRSQILGLVVVHVPLEEYVFYVLQVFVTGLLTVALLRRSRP